MKMALGVVRPEMAMDLGSKEVEPMIDKGAVHGIGYMNWHHCIHVHGDIASSWVWVHGMVVHHSW